MKRSLLLLALVAACSDADPKGWLVDRTRPIAARVEAAADPRRASLVPAEPARVLWDVASPDGKTPPRLAWAFALCVQPTGTDGSIRCDGAPLVSGAGEDDSRGAIAMPFTTPSQQATELLLLAAFCEGGPVLLDAHAFGASCGSGGPAILASVNVRLAADGANENPDIAADAVSFDGAMLPAPAPASAPATAPAAGAPCTGAPDAPVVLAGSGDHAFAFRFDGEQREATPGGYAPVESLVASHFVTLGALDRQFSYLDPQESAPKTVSVTWSAPDPDATSPAGRIVDAHFVLRDGRGGAAFTRRTLCLRNP